MTWFKVDDSFHSHPKVLAASPAALGLWVVAGSWSGATLSEGFIPDHVLPRLLPDSAPLAKELVTAGLWKRTRGGYRFHDWIAYQPSREEATAGREKMSSGGALGNHRRWHAGKGKSDPRCRYCQAKQDRAPDRVGDGVGESRPNPPVPARPDPFLRGGSSTTVTNDRAHEDQPPPSRCDKHMTDPDPGPCRPCGDARKAREQWDRDHAAALTRLQSERARRQAEATRAAIDACRLCDTTGYRNHRLCTHDPEQDNRVRRGADAARAAIRRPDREAS